MTVTDTIVGGGLYPGGIKSERQTHGSTHTHVRDAFIDPSRRGGWLSYFCVRERR